MSHDTQSQPAGEPEVLPSWDWQGFYDEYGRLLKVVDREGSVFTYSYNELP